MKVLQLGPYPPPHGGVQTHLSGLVSFLREQHITCEVVNLTRFQRLSKDGIFFPNSSLAVLYHLIRHRYDIIHLHIGGRIWPRQLGLALLCCSLPNTKCVFTFHSGGYPSSPEGRSARAHTLRGFVLRRFDKVIAVNAEIAKFFRQLQIPADRIRLISPSFVCRPNEQGLLPTEIRQFVSLHRPLFVSVGGLEPEYDVGLQMRALDLVRKHYPQAGLLVIGSGSLEANLRTEVSLFPCVEHIFMSGDLAHTATLHAIQCSDLMLRTTWYDGDAISVREALYFGIPVIATNNGMRPEGVRLIPARNLDALVQAVEEVLSTPRPPNPLISTDSKHNGDNNRNLESVLRLYEELLCKE